MGVAYLVGLCNTHCSCCPLKLAACIGSHDQVSSENEPSGISSNIQTFRDIQEMLENPRLAEMQKFLLL